jgi:mannose/fructose-specific phosphotransferase system component IIA
MGDYGIILVSHGELCHGLYQTAEIVFGTLENVAAVPFKQNQPLEAYKEELLDALERYGYNSIILADLFAGTPFNLLLNIGKETRLNAVCGMNLSMLIAALDMRSMGRKPEEVLEELCIAGRDGIKNITEYIDRIRQKIEEKR